MTTLDMPTTKTSMPARSRFTIKTEGERFALVGAWLLLIVIFGTLMPDSFLSWRSFSTLFGSQAVLVVLTLAIIIPLTSGDFDLSGASTLTMSTMLIAVLNVKFGWPIVPVIVIALVSGIVIGAVNAFFVLYFRIHSLIVTLGVGTFANGLILWVSNSQTISGVSMGLVKWVIINRLFGIPLAFFYALILAVILWYALEFTIAGRKLLFVGRGREVSRLNGINVDRVRATSFVLSGLISAFAGMLYAGMTGSADPLSGLNLLLPAFAAAFLGATTISPGRFNAFGAVISVYFLVTGITGLTMLGADAYVQNLFYGGALVIAVSLSQLVRNRQPQDFS
ncbi:ABC transporter permease [Rhizobium sp. VS19-DR104.2]|uniref:ABC transporter permease n=1 Tax=unclassified Rhizobium TaxID=2613769 RepID=UPI001ADAEBCD|nr:MULTISPECIES: ABC transporter permease [unclassified Rhizobium]MBO9101632.1 ABC transporter permease [Rhizobium sp. L58/93]MBO9187625.1 ABC transporter permease [Rhizobium sp. E27B/91]MBZ5761258.1 ABC transporter permease [Rhizobium sp. VS19-DR96]MBZ5767012.1 ABC transporter permease [Rhizobium sp. VS19-DR129.2]MBZ5774897.1 ABC transporter permease [Rhizobium sp. VS19-DRK62.2]